MTALALLATRWKEASIAALLVILTITVAAYTASGKRKDAALEACQTASAATVANFRAATEKAKADDLANARAVEQRYASIAEDQSHALQDQLTRARADAAAYANRLRTQAGAAGGGQRGASVSVAATPAGRADAADPLALMASDAQTCATSWVVATGFQDWVRTVSATEAPSANKAAPAR